MKEEKTEDIERENIQITLDTIKTLVSRTSVKDILSAQVYIHGIVHRQDATAVHAGLVAGKYMDERGIGLPSPMDCLLALLVAEYGLDVLDELGEWDVDTFKQKLDAINIDARYEKSQAYIREDAAQVLGPVLGALGASELTEEERMDKLIAALPDDSTEH